jgi:hypothetical protein
VQRLWGVDCERCKNALDALAETNLLRLKLGTIRLWDAIPFGRWTRVLLRAWHVLTSISSKEMPKSRFYPGRPTRQATLPRELRTVAAGVDVGANLHDVPVPEGRGPKGQDVRSFGALTADL